jgi:AAA15 family ATPase/GTPase
MEDFIKYLQIKNFKSIKDLTLDCRRINVFIGKPNVGKSNILEALDLFYLPSMFELNYPDPLSNKSNESFSIQDFFRVNVADNLFYRGDIRNTIELSFRWVGSPKPNILSLDFIKTDDKRGWNRKLIEENFFRLKIVDFVTDFTFDFIPLAESDFHNTNTPIKPFKYKEDIQFHDVGNYRQYLMPPYGNNLAQVIDYIPSLKDFIIDEMSKLSDIDFVIDKTNNTLTQQIRVGKGLVYALPYKSLADTLKRFIFYMAAIKSGYSVITLEEPEAHSFPPYVSRMADEIIETKETQFFIATHSSVLLTNLIENTPKDELAVFVCDYDDKNHQTTATRLSEEQLSEALDYGVDMFFNINHFLDDPIDHTS